MLEIKDGLKLTDEEAAALADKLDLADLHDYLVNFRKSDHYIQDTCYFKDGEIIGKGKTDDDYLWTYRDKWREQKLWYGVLSVAIYRYLVDRKIVKEKSPGSGYYNPFENLYDVIAERLVSAGLVTKTKSKYPECQKIGYYNLFGQEDYAI